MVAHWLGTCVSQPKLCCAFGMLSPLSRMKKWNLSSMEEEDVIGRPPVPAAQAHLGSGGHWDPWTLEQL